MGSGYGLSHRLGLRARRRDVGPRERRRGPQPVEHRVGGVAEAVARAEVVAPARRAYVVAESLEPAHAVRVPRDRLLQAQLTIGGSIGERATPAVGGAEEQATDDVGGAALRQPPRLG